jgi:hypothetical protein
MAQGVAIDKFEFTSNRDAMGYARHRDIAMLELFCQIIGCGIAFNRGIAGND